MDDAGAAGELPRGCFEERPLGCVGLSECFRREDGCFKTAIGDGWDRAGDANRIDEKCCVSVNLLRADLDVGGWTEDLERAADNAAECIGLANEIRLGE